MKKIISLLLSVLICINTLPVQIIAEDENAIEEVKEEIVEVVEDKQEDITDQVIQEQPIETVEEVLVVEEEQNQEEDEIIANQEETIIEEDKKDTNVENTNNDVQPKPMALGASPKPALQAISSKSMEVDDTVTLGFNTDFGISALRSYGGYKITTNTPTSGSGDVITFSVGTLNSAKITAIQPGTAVIQALGTAKVIGNETKNITITVTKKKLTEPTLSKETSTYTGKEQTVTINRNNVDEKYYTLDKNSISGTVVAEYKAKASITDTSLYEWKSDANKANKDYELTFSITPREIDKPSDPSTSATYDGKEHTILVAETDNYNGASITETDAGTYPITVSLKDKVNNKWKSENTDDLTYTLTINKTDAFTIEPIADVVWTGSEVSPKIVVKGLDGNEIDPSNYTVTGNTGTDVNTYTATVIMKNSCTNYTGSKTADWKISNVQTEIKEVKITNESELVYDGNTNTPTFKVYDINDKEVSSEGYDVDGLVGQSVHKTDGNYSFTITGKGAYKTTTPITVEWNIAKAVVTAPSKIDNLKYTAGEQLGVNNAESDLFTLIDGCIRATEAGSYNAKFQLNDKNNYQWSTTNDSDDLNIDWTIDSITIKKYITILVGSTSEHYRWADLRTIDYSNSLVDANVLNEGIVTYKIGTEDIAYKYIAFTGVESGVSIVKVNGQKESVYVQVTVIDVEKISVPSQSGTLTYNGSPQTASFNNYDSSILDASNIIQTNAGTYSATFHIKDTSAYAWSDNTFEDKKVNWKINKADVSVTPIDITYDGLPHSLFIENTAEADFRYHTYSKVRTYQKNDFSTDIPSKTDVGEYSYYWFANVSGFGTTSNNYNSEDWTKFDGGPSSTAYIRPANLTNAVADKPSYEYDGDSHIPTITVSGVPGEEELTDTDYTIKYYNSSKEEVSKAINADTYTAVIKGKHNYSESSVKEVEWIITKTDTPAPSAKESLQYNQNSQDLVSVKPDLGYKYFVSTEVINDLNTLKGKSFDTTAQGCDVGTYYVYWTATGDNNHNAVDVALENVVEVEISAPTVNKVTVSGGIDNGSVFKYTGNSITPTIVVEAGELTLSDSDYTLAKWNGESWDQVDSVAETEIGEYKYKAIGKNTYSGDEEFTFEIIPDITVTVNSTDTTDDRTVATEVDLESKLIKISVTPTSNRYVEKVKVSENSVVKQVKNLLGSDDDDIELTYDTNGVASGTYSIADVKSGEFTIDVTAIKVEAKTNPSVNFIKDIKSVTEDEIVEAVIGEEYKDSGFVVKYDANKMSSGDNWKPLDYVKKEALEHTFGESAIAPEKEKVKITGVDKYAKVSIEKEITLVDDRKTTYFSFDNVRDSYAIPYNPNHTEAEIKDHILKNIKLYDYVSAGNYTEIPYDDEIKSYITVDLYKYSSGNTKANTIELNDGTIIDNYTYVVLTLAPMYTETHHLKGCTSVSILHANRYKFEAVFDIYNHDNTISISKLIKEEDKYYVNISANNTKSQYVSEINVGDDTYDDELTYSYGKANAKVEVIDFEPESKINVTRTLTDAYTQKETRELAYINDITEYESLAALEEAVFDAIIDKSKTDIEYKDVSIKYETYTNDWQNLDYEPKTQLGHKFGSQSSENIRITYKGSDDNGVLEKYFYMNGITKTGLTLDTTLNIIDDRSTPEFVVDGTVEVNAADIDSDEPLYENLLDVIIDKVGLVDKDDNSIDLYELFETNGLDIKKCLSITDSENNGIENILELTPDVDNELTVKFSGIYDTEKNIKYKECSAKVVVKFNRYDTEMYFNTNELHEIEIVYDAEGANLANALFKDGFIVIYNTDKSPIEEVDFENSNITYEPENLDANILRTQNVTVSYNGDELHKPCSSDVAVRVFYAPSKITIGVEDKIFDNKPIDISFTTDPDGLHYAYMIAGLEGDVEGYISLFVDTSNMTFELVPDVDTPIGKISNWIISEIINKSAIFNGHYKDGVLNYGDAVVDLINYAFENNDLKSITELAQAIIDEAEKLGISDKFGDLDNLLNLVDYIIGIREKYNITKVDFRLNKMPDQAGLYAIGAVTLQKNYIPAIDTKLFRISPISLKPTWDQELPENKRIVLKEEGGVDFDFGADIFYETKHDEELGLDIKDETTYTTIYAGVKAATMPDIDFSSNTILENLKEIIKNNTGLDLDGDNIIEQFITASKNNNGLIYLSNKPCQEDGTYEAGAYIEMVIFAGNYQAVMTRAYIIERNETSLLLDDITCTYGDNISETIAAGIAVQANGHSIYKNEIIKNAIIKFVDLPDDTDIQDLIHLDYETLIKKLNILNPFVSDEIPTDAEKYLMVAYYPGDAIYKPTLAIKLLTIHKAKIHVSWNETWANENGGTIGELGYMLTYTYIDHNDQMIEGNQYTITYPSNGIYNTDSDKGNIKLTIRNIVNDIPECDAGVHGLQFILTGTNADNYRIDNGISDPKYINMLGYTILRKDISIGWKDIDDIKNIDVDHADFDGKLSNNDYTLTYTYRGQDDCGVDSYYYIDSDAFKEDAEGVTINVYGQSKNVGIHDLVFLASGKYASNYDIENHITDVVDNTLAYEIVAKQLEVGWDEEKIGETDLIEEDVFKYIYNKQLDYVDDKFKITNPESILDDGIDVTIVSGRAIEAGKHTLTVRLTGTYANNYYLTKQGLLYLGIDTLDYEILPKPVYVYWKDDAGIVEEDKLTYIYNGEINYLSNYFDTFMFKSDDFFEDDDVSVDLFAGNEVNVGEYEATFALFGKDSNNYVLETKKLPYEIVPKEITVEWTKVVFDVASNEIKMPQYEFIGLVKNDSKPFITFEYYDLDGNKISGPSSLGTYLAKIVEINDDNYTTSGETLYTICDFDSLIKNPDYDIVAASINDEVLSTESLVKAKLTECPSLDEAISILSSLDDDTLLEGFTDDAIKRVMTLLLEASHLEPEQLDIVKPLVADKYGEGVYNKSFFLNIDLYTMVSGIISKQHVHEPGYEVPVTIKISKDSEAAKLISGKDKLYYVIRVHDGEVDRIPAKCTMDENGDYLLSFTSDRFSVYGFYCVDKPHYDPGSYVVPKTGIN